MFRRYGGGLKILFGGGGSLSLGFLALVVVLAEAFGFRLIPFVEPCVYQQSHLAFDTGMLIST